MERDKISELQSKLVLARADVERAAGVVCEIEDQISSIVGPFLLESGRLSSIRWTFNVFSVSLSPVCIEDAIDLSTFLFDLVGPSAIVTLADGIVLEVGEAVGEVQICWGGAKVEEMGTDISNFILQHSIMVDVDGVVEADSALEVAQNRVRMAMQVVSAAIHVAAYGSLG